MPHQSCPDYHERRNRDAAAPGAPPPRPIRRRSISVNRGEAAAAGGEQRRWQFRRRKDGRGALGNGEERPTAANLRSTAARRRAKRVTSPELPAVKEMRPTPRLGKLKYIVRAALIKEGNEAQQLLQ